jgi:hypothetical protein
VPAIDVAVFEPGARTARGQHDVRDRQGEAELTEQFGDLEDIVGLTTAFDHDARQRQVRVVRQQTDGFGPDGVMAGDLDDVHRAVGAAQRHDGRPRSMRAVSGHGGPPVGAPAGKSARAAYGRGVPRFVAKRGP